MKAIELENMITNEKAKSYNLGYTHGLKDLKMRALVELWQSARKYQLVDPELYELFKDAISRIEKLN